MKTFKNKIRMRRFVYARLYEPFQAYHMGIWIRLNPPNMINTTPETIDGHVLWPQNTYHLAPFSKYAVDDVLSSHLCRSPHRKCNRLGQWLDRNKRGDFLTEKGTPKIDYWIPCGYGFRNGWSIKPWLIFLDLWWPIDLLIIDRGVRFLIKS